MRERINNIITDLLRGGTYEDFINLQTNKTCNAHAIFEEQGTDQGFKKVELSQIRYHCFNRPRKNDLFN